MKGELSRENRTSGFIVLYLILPGLTLTRTGLSSSCDMAVCPVPFTCFLKLSHNTRINHLHIHANDLFRSLVSRGVVTILEP